MVSERTSHARGLFAGLPASYEAMGAALSFGQDPRWRRFLVSRLPAGSPRVLDVAAGTGLVTRGLLAAGRAEQVIALDQSEPMLAAAASHGDDRARFVLGQAERLPFADATFDALSVTYLLRYVDDPGATLRLPWVLYTRMVPLIGRLVSRDWYEVGRFLGPSIDGFWERYPMSTQVQLWREAGVGAVRWRRMSLGGGIVMWGVRGA